jgi:hypothetical protein
MRRFILTVVVCGVTLLSIGVTRSGAQVSARRALNTVLPELKFDNISLLDAIDFLRDVSGANMHVNWNAIEAVGVGKDTVVNLRLRSVPLRKVLNLVLSEAGSGSLLTFYIDDDVIEVTTREIADQQMYTKVYPVDDLIMEVPDFIGPDFQLGQTSQTGGGGGGTSILGGGAGTNNEEQQMTRLERAEQLMEMVQSIIQPDVWQINGGRAAIRFYNGSLIVTAPRSVHEALGGYVD